MYEARITQIDYFHFYWRIRFDQDVLRFQVGVYDVKRMNGG